MVLRIKSIHALLGSKEKGVSNKSEGNYADFKKVGLPLSYSSGNSDLPHAV